jgi:hypothetical protein
MARPRKLRPVTIPIGLSVAYVELTQGQYAVINSEIASLVGQYNWHAQWAPNVSSFYAVRHDRSGQNEYLGMHSFITGLSPTDHCNHETLNNLPHNLRGCTTMENSANRKKQKNRSGYKGVTVEHGRYRASIRKDKKLISLGTYAEAEVAARVYDAAAIHHYGQFANINFPSEHQQPTQ